MSISFENAPAVAPVTVVGWLSGSATNGMRLLALFDAPMRVKSMPVLPNWFEIQTYAGRPVNRPTPPRICCRAVAAEVPVEADARRPLELVGHDVGREAEVRHRDRVGGRLVREYVGASTRRP